MRWKSEPRSRPQLEILEPRILYSADALSLLQPDALAPSAEVRSLDHYAPAPATTQGAEHALPPPAPTTVDTPAQAQRHEIVFVDTAVSGYQQLVANLKSDLTRSVDVVLIDAARDGVEQISQALAGQHDVSAVHIISYGADGEVLLGTTRLDLDTLLTHAAQIKGWGDALTENADLLLYGCDVAEDAAGQALVQQLALLTGADVAASSDLTGNSTLGGDWVLEYRVGAIETAVAPDAATQQKWVGVLDAWYDPAWSYRQAITIDHTKVAADQTDFPVLISTTDPNWKSTGNGGYVGQTDGGDFVFTLADGVTKLDHQIETYDPTTGQLVAWVRMPTLSSSTDTSIKLYFGNAAAADQWNPTGVWDANFQGVWHLNQGTGVTAVDSTSHADGATPTNNPTASTGEIGGALTFTSTSWMTIGAAAALDLKTYSDWTLSAWVKPTSYAGTKWPIIYSYGTYDASLGLTVREGTDGLIENWTNDATLRQSTTAVTLNAWNYVTISRTAATTTFYLNGVAVGSGTSTAITRSGDPSYIGGGGFVDDQFLGLIDEVRVSGNSTSSGTRSASWIATEYANQNSPGSFYTLVNEAPTLDNTKSPALTAQNEDSGAPSGAVGTLVSSLVDFASPSGQVDNVTDPGAGALLGIAVTTADTANGAWYYSTDSGTNWVALGAVANNNARLLAADANTRLYFQPNANYNGTLATAITFRAWDQTSGTNGTLADTSTNGGTTAFSTATDTASLVVTSVNDAPVGTNNTVTTLEDTAYTFAAADFGFTDPGDSPANALNAVKITTLPGAGTLALSGVAVIAGDFVSVANINSGNLKFTPAANASGAGYAAFTFQVQDDGGTANSGVDLDATPRTMTVDVTAVADTPSVTNATTNEDTQTTSGLVISRNAADGAEVTNFKITGISNGTLYKNDGTTQIANGTFITFAEGNAGLKFTPTANFNGSGSFTAQASTSNADGGLGGSTVNATITVTSVNDAPVGTNKTVTTLEDTAYTFAATDFGFTDPSDSPANALAAVKITTTPGAGTLTLSGLAVNASDFVSVANINAGNLKFTPAANASGAGYAAFTFQVQDDGGTANSGIDLDATPRTMTVNVTAVTVDVIVVNHAPAITSDGAGAAAAVSIPENTTTVTTVTATDSDLPAQTLTYAIAGGADAAKFTINASTGALSFLAAPNFEIPTDADLNNIYQVTVQVSDGMLTDSQAIAVTVTNVNEAPTATNMSAGETYTEDTPHNLAAIAVNDVDSATVTVTLALSDAAAGRLNTGSSGAVTSTYDAGAGVWSASGTIADVNTLLAGLTFTPAPNYNANFSIATSVSDGMAAPLTGGKVMSGVRVNDPPVGVPTITGTPTKDQTLSASTAGISDADRLGAFNYQWLSNGAGIAGATSDTYTLGDADVGTNISVRVAYTDGGGTNETVTSDPTAAVSGTQNNSVLPKNNPVLPINTAAPAGNGTGTGTGNGAGTTSAANNTGTSTSSGTGTTPAANNTGTSTTNPVIRTPDIANSATANNATAASSAARSTPTPAPATESREAPGFSSVNDGSSGAPVLFVQRTVVSGGGGSGTGPTAGSTSSEARVAYRVYLRAGSEPIALSALAPAMVTAQAISPAGPQELPLSSAASGRVLAGSTTGMVSMPGSDAPAAELLNEVTSVAGVARVTGVVVLAGAASWAAQGTTLVAALLAGAPAWQHIDPLPVLGSGEEPTRKKPDEEDEAPAEEDAVANLWRVDAGADTTT